MAVFRALLSSRIAPRMLRSASVFWGRGASSAGEPVAMVNSPYFRPRRPARQEELISRGILPGNRPDLREGFVLAVVAVVFLEYLAEAFREFPAGLFRAGTIPALPVVANTEPGAAIVAKLESRNCVPRVFRKFFIQDRHRSVGLNGHVVLRWG